MIQGKVQWTQKQHANLSELLRHAQNTASSDSKDNIYAFIGLTNLRDKITINYDPAYSMNTVLLDAAQAIITYEDGDLDILAQAGTAAPGHQLPKDNDALPTWVPRFWDKSLDKDVQYDNFIATLDLPQDCAAGSHHKASVTFSADRFGNKGRVLDIRGTLVCTLGTAVDVSQDGVRPWTAFASSFGNCQISTTSLASRGDEVWVLNGMKWPVVLRRNLATHSTTTLVAIAMMTEHGQAHKLMLGGSEATGETKRVKII